jgi:flavin-dependent dehydrogenase
VSSARHDQTNTTWDVVIVGAGPAGAATAITLARFGQRVLLVEEQGSIRVKLGESLPPTSIGLVKHFLGDPEGPEQNLPGLFRTAGNHHRVVDRDLHGVNDRPASSTYGQTFDAQLEELRDAGCIKMYRENVTGANNDWRELPKGLDHLAPGERG